VGRRTGGQEGLQGGQEGRRRPARVVNGDSPGTSGGFWPGSFDAELRALQFLAHNPGGRNCTVVAETAARAALSSGPSPRALAGGRTLTDDSILPPCSRRCPHSPVNLPHPRAGVVVSGSSRSLYAWRELPGAGACLVVACAACGCVRVAWLPG
jgi:hypothetical protein